MLAILDASAGGALLTAGLVLSVPILLHLRNRSRPPIVVWSAMQFLSARPTRDKGRMRLYQRLLLALRCTLLLLTTAAMCCVTPWADALRQRWFPEATTLNGEVGPVHRILVLDLSASMNARREGETLLTRMKARVRDFIGSCRRGDSFTVITHRLRTRVHLGGNRPLDDIPALHTELERLEVEGGPADAEALRKLLDEHLRRPLGSFVRREVVFFTDLQRSAWEDFFAVRSDESRTLADEPVRWVVVDLAETEADNWSIARVEVRDPILLDGRPTEVTATIRRSRREAGGQVRVRLTFAEPPRSEADAPTFDFLDEQTATIGPNGSAVVVFRLSGTKALRGCGRKLLRVAFAEPPPGDVFPDDDERRLVVMLRQSVRVLTIDDSASGLGPKRTGFFLRRALQPFDDEQAPPWQPWRPEAVTSDEFLALTEREVRECPCIALSLTGSSSLPTELLDRLSVWVQSGGVLLLSCGDADTDDANLPALFAQATNLLPGTFLEVRTAGTNETFQFHAPPGTFERPPLNEFRRETDRADLLHPAGPYHRRYVRIRLPTDSSARVLLSFVSSQGAGTMDPAWIDQPLGKGRVLCFTGSFQLAWSRWPIMPTFPPFLDMLLRWGLGTTEVREHACGRPVVVASGTDRVGVTIHGPLGAGNRETIRPGPGGFVPTRGGIYLVESGENRYPLAINLPNDSSGEAESDFTRLSFSGNRPDVLVVTDPTRLPPVLLPPRRSTPTGGPNPLGSLIGYGLLLTAFFVVLAETLLAWYLTQQSANERLHRRSSVEMLSHGRHRLRGAVWGVSGVLAVGVAAGLVCVLFARGNARLLLAMPQSWRDAIEKLPGKPPPLPGEGSALRIEADRFLTGNPYLEPGSVLTLGLALMGFVLLLSRLERCAFTGDRRVPILRHRFLPLALLRCLLLAVFLIVLLPQARIVDERERRPDLVVLLDVSASMNTMDADQTRIVRRFTSETATEQARLLQPHRLNLARALLLGPRTDWLRRAVAEGKYRVHLYAVGAVPRKLGEIGEVGDLDAAARLLDSLPGAEPATALGATLEMVRNDFRAALPAAVLLLSDGVETVGPGMTTLLDEAIRKGESVPRIFPILLGTEGTGVNLALSGLRVAGRGMIGDRLLFEARLSASGSELPSQTDLILAEITPSGRIERSRIQVPLRTDRPIDLRVEQVPDRVGDRVYVLEVPPLPGEINRTDNRLERRIAVDAPRQVRVLLIDDRPRPEFRFLKQFLERPEETGHQRIALRAFLRDATADWHLDEPNALAALPSVEELLSYDVVILGDLAPERIPEADRFARGLVELVGKRGGGLIVSSGGRDALLGWQQTPLAELLPVQLADGASGEPLLIRVRATALGSAHPLGRAALDSSGNRVVWSELSEIVYRLGEMHLKPGAEVLLESVPRAGSGESGLPIVIQQFVGRGRVLFVATEETRRWRAGGDGSVYGRFWSQGLRFVERTGYRGPELSVIDEVVPRVGQPLSLRLRFPEEVAIPPEDLPQHLRIEQHANRVGTLELHRSRSERAAWTGTWIPRRTGSYRLIPQSDPSVRLLVEVLPPIEETTEQRPNRVELAETARLSGGRMIALDEAGELFTYLPTGDRQVLEARGPSWPIWAQPIMLLIITALLAAEWTLRRLERLV